MRTQLTPDQIIGRIASRAHGIVTFAELVAAGFSHSAIRRRVKRGLLIPIYRGVYRVGHRAPSREASYTAAVKAAGDGALIAGRAAAHLLELRRGAVPPPEIACPRRCRVAGLRTRHIADLSPADGTRVHGIPAMTVPRVLVDLAPSLTLDDLGRLFHEATARCKTKPEQVEAVLARRTHHSPGVRKLREVMYGAHHVKLSELEKGFVALLKRADLPLPDEMNQLAGDAFRQYTWADVFEDPRLMLAELRVLLRRSPAEQAA